MRAGYIGAVLLLLAVSSGRAQAAEDAGFVVDGGVAEPLSAPPLETAEEARQPQLAPQADAEAVLGSLNQFFSDVSPNRAQRIDDLAKLADERAGPAFDYVARNDRALSVRVAAARALGSVRCESFTRLAADLADEDSERAEVRAAAMAALGDQQSVAASAALLKIAASGEEPPELRSAALSVLREKYPQVALSTVEPPHAAGRSAVGAMTVVGAASGAYALGLVGTLSSDEGIGLPIGIVGGAVIGGTGGLLLARSTEVTYGDAGYLFSAGAWSVPIGWWLGAGASDTSRCDKSCNAVALATHLGVMGVA